MRRCGDIATEINIADALVPGRVPSVFTNLRNKMMMGLQFRMHVVIGALSTLVNCWGALRFAGTDKISQNLVGGCT
jgi:hypothetical protein